MTDGLKRADKGKLPSVIRDFISQHHGRGKAKYFYTMYCRENPDGEADAEAFTYPGPNPQTREASLLMMADSVEAASRSMTDYSQEAIKILVDRLIDTQVAEGLHNDSPLSFRDIRDIKECFISRLRSMYHARVSYPPEATGRISRGSDNGPAAGESDASTLKMAMTMRRVSDDFKAFIERQEPELSQGLAQALESTEPSVSVRLNPHKLGEVRPDVVNCDGVTSVPWCAHGFYCLCAPILPTTRRCIRGCIMCRMPLR